MMDVRLPQWGMEMTEGVIVEWYKSPGEHVAEGEPLAEIETGKVTGVLEAPTTGTVTEIVVAAGAIAQIFDVVAIIDEG